MEKCINIYLLGGTISKKNEKFSNNYIKSLLKQSRLLEPNEYCIIELYENDSIKLFENDIILNKVINTIISTSLDKNVIIMGTDRLINMAKLLESKISKNKLYLLMGSMIPYNNRIETDAIFNFGYVLGSFNSKKKGVFICMHGKLLKANNIFKDYNTLFFRNK